MVNTYAVLIFRLVGDGRVLYQKAKIEKDPDMPDGSVVKRAGSIFLHFTESTAPLNEHDDATSILE